MPSELLLSCGDIKQAFISSYRGLKRRGAVSVKTWVQMVLSFKHWQRQTEDVRVCCAFQACMICALLCVSQLLCKAILTQYIYLITFWIFCRHLCICLTLQVTPDDSPLIPDPTTSKRSWIGNHITDSVRITALCRSSHFTANWTNCTPGWHTVSLHQSHKTFVGCWAKL